MTTCRDPHLPIILHYLSANKNKNFYFLITQGSRPLSELTRHFTTRTDDSHATPDCILFDTIIKIETNISHIKLYIPLYKLGLVRFYADYRIKPHAPLLGLISVNSFEF